MHNKDTLDGKLAIVTGGAQGIGKVVCLTLAREGADLAIGDMNLEGARQTVAEVRQLGRKAMAFQLDVADEKSVKSFYDSVLAEFGKVDILVNCAAICSLSPILDLDVAEWDRVLAVNLRGAFLMSREAFRLMKDHRQGKIIGLASAAAKLGGVAVGAHYASSKAGVICLMKSLALQAAPYHIHVNVVCPGPIKSALTDAWGDEINTNFKARIPWKDYGEPQDVADAVAFLVSDRARYITGEILDVNGGLVMD